MSTYNTTWNRISADAKLEFNCAPAYNKKFLKAKISFYGDEATDFHDKEVPKIDSSYTCLAFYLNRYNIIWDKISNDAKLELNCEPEHYKKFSKIKTKIYGNGTTDFHDIEVP